MAVQEKIALEVSDNSCSQVEAMTLGAMGVAERQLQDWVLRYPHILGEGVEVVTSEFSEWLAAGGHRVRDRLDILGIDRTGRLVLAELKNGEAPHSVHMEPSTTPPWSADCEPRTSRNCTSGTDRCPLAWSKSTRCFPTFARACC